MAIERKIDLEFGEGTVDIVDTTGDYDVDSNPTGYGTPNAGRTDLERYVALRKKNVNDIPDENWVTHNYDEQFTRDRDGWYEGVMFSVRKWDSGTEYTDGSGDTDVDIVAYNGALYRALRTTTNDVPPASASDWEQIFIGEPSPSEDDLLLIVNTTVVKTYKNRTTVYDADVYYSNLMAEKTQDGLSGLVATAREDKRLYDIYRKIQQALSADQRENNSYAEWIVLALRIMGAKATT